MSEKKEKLERLDQVAMAAITSDSYSEWLEEIGWKPSDEEIEEDLKMLKEHIEECDNCTESSMCEYHKALAKSLQDTSEWTQEKIEKRVEELEEETLLAEREAEAYVLTEEIGLTIQQAADQMGVGFGRVSGARTRIKEKLKDAEATVERVEI